jgi:hypothetical protein
VSRLYAESHRCHHNRTMTTDAPRAVSRHRVRTRSGKPNNPRTVALELIRTGLPQTLGIESVALLAVLDALAATLDDAQVFDGLRADDSRRVAGALAWLAVLDTGTATAADLARQVGVRGIRAQGGLDGVPWHDRLAVRGAFLKAAAVL